MIAAGAAAALMGLQAAPAGADAFESVFGATFEETSHAVRVRLDEGYARYVVRRTVRNKGEISDEMSLSIGLPSGATAVGLRVRSGGRWHRAKLLDAEPASQKYAELTDILEDRPERTRTSERRPTLLGWTAAGELGLKTFPVRVGESVTFEYTLAVPACYAAGRIWLDYPDPGGERGLAPPVIAVETGAHGGAVILHRPSATGAARPGAVDEICDGGIRALDGTATVIEIRPREIHQAAIRYGLYRTAGERAVARLDIDAAEVLEPAPRGARVVFVLDGSWSVGDDELSDQLALVRGYLAHVPDARFELVVFRRDAERLLGRFAPATAFDEVAGELPRHRRRLGNGSNLEEGVALAANLLADARGPARVVVFTDGRTRDAFTPELAIAALAPLPRGGVVHVALRTSPWGGMSEERVDDAELAPVAGAYGGMAIALGGEPTDPGEVAATMLGLVRPIRIDEFTIGAAGVEALESMRTDSDALEEGTGERYMLLLPDAPKELQLSGMIWGRRWTRTVEVDDGLTAQLPALLFGNSLYTDLTDREQLVAARDAGAVSPQTSYLEAEQRIVPIPEDLRDIGGFGISGYGTCGCGGYGTMTSCGGGIGIGSGHGTWEDRPTPEELLRAWMLPRAAMCARAGGRDGVDAVLTIEATGDEIVGVRVEGEMGDSVRSCIVDAAWEQRLTGEFSFEHGYYATELHATAR